MEDTKNIEMEDQVLELGPLYDKVKEIAEANKEAFKNDQTLTTVQMDDVFAKFLISHREEDREFHVIWKK